MRPTRAVAALSCMLLLSSCGEAMRMRSIDMRRESPEIARWAERTDANVIGILQLKLPQQLNPAESAAVERVVRRFPNSFSSAARSLRDESAEEWRDSIMNGDHVARTMMTCFSGINLSDLSSRLGKSDSLRAWMVTIQRSNNHFGDIDGLLVVISSDAMPMAYGYFGVNAGSPDQVCASGIYIPADRIAPDRTPAKTIDDLPVPAMRR